MMYILQDRLKSWKIWVSGIALIGLLLITVQYQLGSQKPTPPSPPEISNFHLNRIDGRSSGPIYIGEEIGIRVDVDDNDHKLSYWWVVKAGKGSIRNGQGTHLIIYEAPQTPGNYNVGVEIQYGGGSPVEGSLLLEVIPKPPTPEPRLTDTPLPTPREYNSKVLDENTREPIVGAKVKFEFGSDFPRVTYTDGEGIYRFEISFDGDKLTGLVIVEAKGYQIYERNIPILRDSPKLENIHLDRLPAPPPVLVESPTPMLTVTSTATPVPPTPTPTPTPEAIAIVVAANGLNLRNGPGTIYGPPIGFLRKDDILDVKGRIASNEWIQVVPVISGTLGWVSAASQFVQIYVDLNTIPIVEPPLPPIPTPVPAEEVTYPFASGPNLYHPIPYVSYTIGDIVPFTWQEYSLAENQYYAIIIVHKDLPPEQSCIHTQTQQPEIYLKLDCPRGIYRWWVAIATELPEGSEQECPDSRYNRGWCSDSMVNNEREFGLDVKHPNERHDGGNGGNGDGGGSGEVPSDP